ncbi:TetR family transcriptional regulator [Mycolicibacterium murale]|uniref:TetR family transcriptional regulator n=1 Tax=Mycolicibacterium murale TaxID=182220 RepID=A0A7I9WHT4_9MYCO|nr:TetR/AcrR family transcriptional regulator [Mycolicibacterium murale]ANW66746.1 TetR family transcriptional regulator [Mycobacterium sp. djl-10]MCV7185191.1 TetR/AcrR family transcriptional regulator [Mycolicibacterium murale]GFG57213.1 TetR family transcriptional regulator [Mycolicibacterium murale]
MNPVRPYRGVDARERDASRRQRFLEAGLDLLGGEDAPEELTVRTICKQAGLSLRYFYESFTDKDDFVAAVFDSVTGRLAATTQAAVAAAPAAEQNRAGIANIVAIISEDPRLGRLLFSTRLSNRLVLIKRAEQGGIFAMLSREHIQSALQVPGNSRISAVAHFVVGGVVQTLSAWLSGEIALGPDELVEQLHTILDQLHEPQLFRA